VSFEVSPEQIEVHVLPQFTIVEMIASVGGLLFIGYIFGRSVFSHLANFYMENELTSKLYKNIGQLKAEPSDKSPFWCVPHRDRVRIVDFREAGADIELASDRILDRK